MPDRRRLASIAARAAAGLHERCPTRTNDDAYGSGSQSNIRRDCSNLKKIEHLYPSDWIARAIPIARMML
jgi:hypothetical protein